MIPDTCVPFSGCVKISIESSSAPIYVLLCIFLTTSHSSCIWLLWCIIQLLAVSKSCCQVLIMSNSSRTLYILCLWLWVSLFIITGPVFEYYTSSQQEWQKAQRSLPLYPNGSSDLSLSLMWSVSMCPYQNNNSAH